jgi:ADP-dependent NAD(P)H-hydrate dehydratase / NAD(P)H-hydrate epimerase
MSAVTCSEMRAAEATAIAAGWSEEQLLDLAGERLGRAIARFFPHPGTVVGYLGKGHNAGDALVALRVLKEEFGWNIAARPAFPIEKCAPLTRMKWLECAPPVFETKMPWRDLKGPLVLLDGLLGIGACGALRDPLLKLAAEMEWLRHHTGANIAAVDLPSGVDADSGEPTPGAVTADVTFMIGNAKRGLLQSHAVNSVGALALVPVEILTAAGPGKIELICPQQMDFGKSPRPYDFHKGLAGRVAVIAGSARYPGAAVLAATGALRGGAGLVTLHVPQQAAAVIAAKCPPEIIIRSYASVREIGNIDCDAIVIGCGLGELEDMAAAEFLDWLGNQEKAAVIDADALNLIAKHGRQDIFRNQQVLTPHPGEFRRLAPDLADLPREKAAKVFSERHPSTLLLKGGRTLVTRTGQPIWCNATGSPGMATGGQGDLLAGLIGARLAAGLAPHEAAAQAAWLCGRAAEISLENRELSPESMTPSDCAMRLGAAFRDWQGSRR